jgi:cytochrome c biogenesis protein CcmG, thiol:disulfide interchange protein DsbE
MPGSSGWSNAAWIALAVIIVALLVGIFLRVRDENTGPNIASAIVKGERPVAPLVPSEGIAGDGAPSLPDWYKVRRAGGPAMPGQQVMVVNFWASWCGPCREEAPMLDQIAKEYDGKAVVVGVNAASEDTATDARAFVREHDLDFPIVRAARSVNEAWGVRGYPETFIVGADGKVSARARMTRTTWILLAALAATLVVPAVGAAQQARADIDEISRKVMCPSCETTLDRSNSPAAERMRGYIEARIEDGWTEEQIIDGLVEEYGGDTSIIATPGPTSSRGALAWGVPALVALLCLVAGALMVRRWRRVRSALAD